jgi:hypothetical protein
MEALTRMVADSLARHGLDRPIDKPGIFALAEEVMNLGSTNAYGETDALVRPAEQSSAAASSATTADGSSIADTHGLSAGAALQRCDAGSLETASSAADLPQRRMLAVLQFSEDDDMAFTLDRMFTRINPMRDRLASGRCFLRFVVIQDQSQRRSICAALNQWILSSAEKAAGLPADFSSSLEMATDRVGRTLLSDTAGTVPTPAALSQPTGNKTNVLTMPRNLDSGAAKNLHCPHPLPSGF